MIASVRSNRQEGLHDVNESVKMVLNDNQRDKEQIDIGVDTVSIQKKRTEDQSTSYKL